MGRMGLGDISPRTAGISDQGVARAPGGSMREEYRRPLGPGGPNASPPPLHPPHLNFPVGLMSQPPPLGSSNPPLLKQEMIGRGQIIPGTGVMPGGGGDRWPLPPGAGGGPPGPDLLHIKQEPRDPPPHREPMPWERGYKKQGQQQGPGGQGGGDWGRGGLGDSVGGGMHSPRPGGGGVSILRGGPPDMQAMGGDGAGGGAGSVGPGQLQSDRIQRVANMSGGPVGRGGGAGPGGPGERWAGGSNNRRASGERDEEALDGDARDGGDGRGWGSEGRGQGRGGDRIAERTGERMGPERGRGGRRDSKGGEGSNSGPDSSSSTHTGQKRKHSRSSGSEDIRNDRWTGAGSDIAGGGAGDGTVTSESDSSRVDLPQKSVYIGGISVEDGTTRLVTGGVPVVPVGKSRKCCRGGNCCWALLIIALAVTLVGVLGYRFEYGITTFFKKKKAYGFNPDCTSYPTALPNAAVPEGFCAYVFAKNVNAARGILTSPSGEEVIVVEKALGRISAFWDSDLDGVSSEHERVVLVSQGLLNHGVEIDPVNRFLYASTSSDIFRWSYHSLRQPVIPGSVQVVLSGMPNNGLHLSRTLRFLDGDLYVSVGSAEQVDANPDRSLVLKMTKQQLATDFYIKPPFAWNPNFGVVASGLRNGVGLRADETGALWGMENGPINVVRSDWNDPSMSLHHPCEELNRFVLPEVGEKAKFYGYPYCWSEGLVASSKGLGPGTQWSQWQYHATYTDTWCRNTGNVVPPALCFPAHQSPLDIEFGPVFGTLREGETREAYVTMHGTPSGAELPKTGYKVTRVAWDEDDQAYISLDLLKYNSTDATGPGWPRPVGLAKMNTRFGPALLVSADEIDGDKSTSVIIAIVGGHTADHTEE
eukprot:g33920.t1